MPLPPFHALRLAFGLAFCFLGDRYTESPWVGSCGHPLVFYHQLSSDTQFSEWRDLVQEDRYMVFQALPHTLAMESGKWKVLDLCHRRRNLSEYEGHLEVDEVPVADLISVTLEVLRRVEALGPVPGSGK